MTPDEAQSLAKRWPDSYRLAMLTEPFDQELILDIAQGAPASKPRAFWYACGTEWISWVSSEMPSYLKHAHLVYRLDVDLPRMAVIRTLGELHAFSKGWSPGGRAIDWGAVAEAYDGIEICPYQWDARYDYDTGWYYPWDVASGAVWRARAVKEATLVYTDEKTRERMDRMGVEL